MQNTSLHCVTDEDNSDILKNTIEELIDKQDIL